MKKILVTELWGNLFSPDLEFAAKSIQDALKQYKQKRKLGANVKIVYDSKNNLHIPSNLHLCAQEGYYEGENKYIRGKRYFYKIYQPE